VVDNYLNSIDYAIIGLYLAVLVVLGLHLKRRASTGLEQYLLGNRSMPWWMLGVSGVMDFWDLAGTMIIVSFLFLLGPRGLFIEFRGGAVLVLAVAMLWTGKWHRRSGCLTSAEWMLFRFGGGVAGQSAQLARAVAGIIVTVGMIAYLVKGTGLFLSVFLPFSPAQCAFVVVASATVYSMFSGFYGVVIIHILQLGIVLAAMATIVVLSLQRTANLDYLANLATQVTGNADWIATAPTVEATMPAGYKPYQSLMLLAGLYLVRNVLFGMGAGDDPKYFAARSDADCGKLTLLWTSLMAFRWPMMIGLAVLGLSVMHQIFPDHGTPEQVAAAVRAHYPDADWATLTAEIAHYPASQPTTLIAELQRMLGNDWPMRLQFVSDHGTINPERVMPAVLLYAIPPGLRSLMVVSLIAAAMAGFGAWVNQAAGFFTRDIYQKHARPSASVHELMVATWTFIASIVGAGFLFAFFAPSINDVWAWIIMGLGSGMMFPQLLPLYWRRCNGFGYTVGMIAGVVTALVQRIFGSSLGSDWGFLNEERWLMPIIGLVGLVATVVGSLISAPTAAPVLRHFYNRTLPFGFWSPDRERLPTSLRHRVTAEHRRELAALPLALLFQIAAFMTPMLAIIRNWEALAMSAGVTAFAFAGLYVVWLRRIDESDAIVAEALRVLPDAGPMQVVATPTVILD
jgi:Na+/proline symporter